MSVKIGSARIDENGHAHGGKAGNQTGKEQSTQSWYQHSKGWRVFRFKNPEYAERAAAAMEAACKNPHIGYDQYQRLTLFEISAGVDPIYYPGAVTKDCETDCSSLVRNCIAYALGRDPFGTAFVTSNQPTAMMNTGLFVELTDAKYTTKEAYLKRGDIQVTKQRGIRLSY